MKIKAVFALIVVSALFMLALTPAFAAQPAVNVTSGECKVGETVTVLLSMTDVAGFTAGDLHLQYNPHMVRLTKIEDCDDINSKGVYHAETELIKDENELDADGMPVHNLNISLFHEEQFPQSLNTCELFRLTFTALSGGECPLVIAASSFNINDEEVYPVLNSGLLKIEGEEGQTWDYEKGVIDDVIYTDADYPYAPLNPTVPRTYASTGANTPKPTTEKKSNAIAIIAVVVVVIVAAIVVGVVVSGRKKYVKE
ncbi:MAG: hypothetical protein IK118_07245 [Clostridia bacterium]|nr:hypothetical protein [Clostridia bacterium]MBR5428126.1 hypothetical protein [Clostridia bacterium]